MTDHELMVQLEVIETEIGAPRFWEQHREVFGLVCDKHCRLLSEAVDRGLTTFSTTHARP